MDLEWLQTNWVIVAVASGGALLVLILLVVLLAGSGKRAKPAGKKANAAVRPASKAATRAAPTAKAAAGGKSSPAAPPVSPAPAPIADEPERPARPRASLVLDLGASKPEDWKTPGGEAARVLPSPSGLRLVVATGAVSVTSAPAQQGDQFTCDYEVRLVDASPNGAPANFFVGPVMRDAAGKLISYWLEQPPLTADQPVRKGSTEVTAPEGTATVHLGVHGSWRADGQHGNATVEFTRLALRQK